MKVSHKNEFDRKTGDERMALIVQKYGGTSVKTVERVKHVAKHIESFRNQGHDLITHRLAR